MHVSCKGQTMCLTWLQRFNKYKYMYMYVVPREHETCLKINYNWLLFWYYSRSIAYLLHCIFVYNLGYTWEAYTLVIKLHVHRFTCNWLIYPSQLRDMSPWDKPSLWAPAPLHGWNGPGHANMVRLCHPTQVFQYSSHCQVHTCGRRVLGEHVNLE